MLFVWKVDKIVILPILLLSVSQIGSAGGSDKFELMDRIR
jgi:hypothetical protein